MTAAAIDGWMTNLLLKIGFNVRLTVASAVLKVLSPNDAVTLSVASLTVTSLDATRKPAFAVSALPPPLLFVV
jgi:hypothetical protein